MTRITMEPPPRDTNNSLLTRPLADQARVARISPLCISRELATIITNTQALMRLAKMAGEDTMGQVEARVGVREEGTTIIITMAATIMITTTIIIHRTTKRVVAADGAARIMIVTMV